MAGELVNIIGEMVSFDIKATDRRGAPDGLSTTTSAFVSFSLLCNY